MGKAVNGRPARLARLVGATAMACVLAATLLPADTTRAQMLGSSASIPQGEQMLLEADNLVFDRDKNTVTAAGNVQIEYGGNHLVAQRVVYNRTTRRVLASGKVEIVDSKKNHIFADEMDVTDDFRDGFANALRAETPEKTYMGADSAERAGGAVTIFNRGVYTACAPCEDKPNRPPVWRIKARTVVWNGQSKTIRFHHSRFEFFGLPIAYFPQFEIPDPTVKRKTGLLMPRFSFNDQLGFGYTQPFYVALTPTYDITLYPTYYAHQGFFGAAEFRQKFNNGSYSITAAGIRQQDPGAFDNGTVDRGANDDPNRWRGMVGTQGKFEINPRWTFGWDVMAQTDKDFSRIYGLNGYNDYYRRNEVYLTGLNGRNYFDLRFMKFNVQENVLDDDAGLNNKQPWVLPSLDYSYTPNEPVAGGELTFNANIQSLYRSNLQQSPDLPSAPFAIQGIEGSDTRFTAEVKWRRQFITDLGIVITPSLGLRGDAIYANYSGLSRSAINTMAADPRIDAATDIRSDYYRYMATAGLEVAWPILFSTPGASHIIEPVAQIFVRPNAPYQGRLGIPNEDAQSMVFDATNLFDEDKFSGYDRIEGGTRANLGFRYTGSFNNGWSANGIFGQSFQLAGENPYAQPDLVNAGAYSGLETDRSDYVALAGVTSPNGISFATAGRFDKDSFAARRLEARAGYTSKAFSIAARYAYIEAQPLYGFKNVDRQQITLSAAAQFARYWRVFGTSTYDMENNAIISESVGIGYLDDCFGFNFGIGQSYNVSSEERRTNVSFNISFRTIGDFGSNTGQMFTRQD